MVGNTSVIVGKATVNGVGNYTFQANVIGNAQSTSDNFFGLQVTDPSGKVVPDLSFSPINLKGGKIVVPQMTCG